jgi:hypothetical protein
MRSARWLRLAVAPSLVALIGLGASAAAAAPESGSESGSHPIHPGVAVTFAGVTCQAGLALHQGATVYLAVPASCGGPQPGQPQNGCTQAEAPTGLPVQVAGAKHRATLVYNSFSRMQLAGTTNRDSCDYNDLALIELNPADRHLVSGTIPGANAPHAVSAHGPASGSAVSLGGASTTAEASSHDGWVYNIRAIGPSKASEVGEPLVQSGRILGMLEVLPWILPLEPSAKVYNLHRALVALRRTNGFHHVVLLRAGQHG